MSISENPIPNGARARCARVERPPTRLELKVRLRTARTVLEGLEAQGQAEGRRMNTVEALRCFNRADPVRREVKTLEEAIAALDEFEAFDTVVTL